jgi:hypothetical protein
MVTENRDIRLLERQRKMTNIFGKSLVIRETTNQSATHFNLLNINSSQNSKND